MKLFVPLHLMSIMVIVASSSSCGEYYDKQIDSLNIQGIVSCPKRIREFTGCFIDRNPCDEITLKIKKILTEVLDTQCAKCSPLQRQYAKRYFTVLKEQYPEDYELFRKKYDPEGKRMDALMEALACD